MENNSILSDCDKEVIHKFTSNPTGSVPDSLRSTTVATLFSVTNQLVDISSRCDSVFKTIGDRFYELNKRINSAQKSLESYTSKTNGKERRLMSAEIPELLEEKCDVPDQSTYQKFDFFSLPVTKKRVFHSESVPNLQCVTKLLPDKSISVECQYSSTGRLPTTKPTSATSSTTVPISTASSVTPEIQPIRRNAVANRNQLPVKSSVLSTAAKHYLAQSNRIRLSSTHPRSSSIFTFPTQSGVSQPPTSSLPATVSPQTPSMSSQSSTDKKTVVGSTPSPAPPSTQSTFNSAQSTYKSTQTIQSAQSSRPPAYSTESINSNQSFHSVQSDDQSESDNYSPPTDILQSLSQPVKQQRTGLPPPPPPAMVESTSRQNIPPSSKPAITQSQPIQTKEKGSRNPPPIPSARSQSSQSQSQSQQQDEPPYRPLPFLNDLSSAAAARQKRIEEKGSRNPPPIPSARSQSSQSQSQSQQQDEPPHRPLPFLNDLSGAAAARQKRIAEQAQVSSPANSLGNRSIIRKAGTLGSRNRTTPKAERFGAGVLDMVRGDTIGRLRVVAEGEGEAPPKPTGNPLLDEIMRFDRSKLKKVDNSTSRTGGTLSSQKKVIEPSLAELFRSRLDVMQTDSESDSDSFGDDFSD